MQLTLKRTIKKFLTPKQIYILIRMYQRACRFFGGHLYSDDLNKLALVYGSDKYGFHYYTEHYSKYFYQLRHKNLKVLEIGVGGYEDPNDGGSSLRMWKRYFSNSSIYAIDIHDKSAQQESRIKILQGSQADEVFLKDMAGRNGPFDIIIDDGSHVVSHIITSFKTLFPHLKEDGIYVIEDMDLFFTSDNRAVSMDFLKGLVANMNYREFLRPDYVPTYFDKHTVGVHFYHNIVFIFKGHNNTEHG